MTLLRVHSNSLLVNLKTRTETEDLDYDVLGSEALARAWTLWSETAPSLLCQCFARSLSESISPPGFSDEDVASGLPQYSSGWRSARQMPPQTARHRVADLAQWQHGSSQLNLLFLQ